MGSNKIRHIYVNINMFSKHRLEMTKCNYNLERSDNDNSANQKKYVMN